MVAGFVTAARAQYQQQLTRQRDLIAQIRSDGEWFLDKHSTYCHVISEILAVQQDAVLALRTIATLDCVVTAHSIEIAGRLMR
eukprot:12185548-Prorocentrum_lima.AAC.1